MREPLRAVLKQTISKEVTTLFRFFDWCVSHKHKASLPKRPTYPKKSIGVRSGPQRAAPVQTTHEDMLKIIAVMPEWTARGGRNHGEKTAKAIPVRDLARLAYETGLRPSTIGRLSKPEHVIPGERRRWIPPDIDKGRNDGRWVALSAVAFDIVQRHLKPGVLFGRHDLRGSSAGPQAPDNDQALPGADRRARQRHVSGPTRAAKRHRRIPSARKRLRSGEPRSLVSTGCEGGDLNPYGVTR